MSRNTRNVVERVEGKQFTVDPDLTEDDVILLLKRSALAVALLPRTQEKYGCDEKRCKDFAYLPLIPRTANQEHSDYFNRKYALGMVVCLEHHTIRPARREDVAAFKRGELKFLWLEWLREDVGSRNGRGKMFPHPQELEDTVAQLRKCRKIDSSVAREVDWALGKG